MKNYLIEKDYQIVIIANTHIIGGYDFSAVFYKNHCLYLDEPEIKYIQRALNNGYELLGIIQGKDYKEIKRQLKNITQAL